MLCVPMPPGRLLPGRARGRDGLARAQYERARHGMLHAHQKWHEQCCMHARQSPQRLAAVPTSFSENCRNRRFSESEAESPCASRDACKWNDMHKNTRFIMKKLHGMRVRMRHAPPARNASCVRRVERHAFSAKNNRLIEVSCTCQDRKSHGQACA